MNNQYQLIINFNSNEDRKKFCELLKLNADTNNSFINSLSSYLNEDSKSILNKLKKEE